jgi:DNA-binding transcriptional ArsR family regulator
MGGTPLGMRGERLSEEEETYSTIFTALRHTIRRRILRMLAKEPMTFTDMLNRLGIESPHLTYHLDSLGVLLAKTERGQYRLSTFGQAAVSMMGWVEDAPKTEPKLTILTTKWKAIVIVLIVGIAVLSSVCYWQYGRLDELYRTVGEGTSQLYEWLPAVRIEHVTYNEKGIKSTFWNCREHELLSHKRVAWAQGHQATFIEAVTSKAEDLGVNHMEINHILQHLVYDHVHAEYGFFEQDDLTLLPCVVVKATYDAVDAWVIVFNWVLPLEGNPCLGHIQIYVVECGTEQILLFKTCR